MSGSNNNGLPRSFGNVFPSNGDLPHVDQGERMFHSSSNGGTGNHASPTLSLPPLVILPEPRFLQAEKYEVTLSPIGKKTSRWKFYVCTYSQYEIAH